MTSSELFRHHLSLMGNPDDGSIYTEDVVVDLPYAPQHHTGKLDGKAHVLRFLTNIGVYFSDVQIGEPTIYETGDPNMIIAEYTGASMSKETGLPYRQDYVSFVTVKDGKIAHIREYYNPIKVLVATGEMTEPGSD
ncbi:MAG: nuclear transport factor 2 family protein [Chlorobia bacterium]|nr:nuclear transport factor 2 family protein [Fimbriimonadaceae bacterium]